MADEKTTLLPTTADDVSVTQTEVTYLSDRTTHEITTPLPTTTDDVSITQTEDTYLSDRTTDEITTPLPTTTDDVSITQTEDTYLSDRTTDEQTTPIAASADYISVTQDLSSEIFTVPTIGTCVFGGVKMGMAKMADMSQSNITNACAMAPYSSDYVAGIGSSHSFNYYVSFLCIASSPEIV
ncbi:uncharacterized protein LOC102808148 [Saccoglossus kowalevskii]